MEASSPNGPARQSPIVDDFQRYFAVDIADTEEQRNAVFSVRYHVYCVEFGYEALEEFPDELERDSFDEHSIQCLVTHKPTGVPAGCLRLVLCDPERQLPMEAYCSEAIAPDYRRLLADQRNDSCEISRLAVHSKFRRRSGEEASRYGATGASLYTLEERRTFPLIAVAAYLSGFALSDLLGRQRMHAMMEPFLPRMLSRSGIRVDKIGEEIDYHGLRAPYLAFTDDVVNSMKPDLRVLYAALYARFRTQLAERGITVTTADSRSSSAVGAGISPGRPRTGGASSGGA